MVYLVSVCGVTIPALYSTPTDTAILSSEPLTHILRVLSVRGMADWWEGPIEDFLTPELLASGLAQRHGHDGRLA
jgi:isoleucyl-tRNA synthetase